MRCLWGWRLHGERLTPFFLSDDHDAHAEHCHTGECDGHSPCVPPRSGALGNRCFEWTTRGFLDQAVESLRRLFEGRAAIERRDASVCRAFVFGIVLVHSHPSIPERSFVIA